jgi:hypothetical protein
MEDNTKAPTRDPRVGFFDDLIRDLNKIGVSVEVHKDVYVGSRGKVYRPFLLVPSVGLAVAIEPNSEESICYKKLGLVLIALSAQDLEPSSRVNALTSIIAYITSTKLETKKRTLIRVNLCYGRRAVKETIAALPAASDSYLVLVGDTELSNIKAYPSHGGLRVILRPKRKTRDRAATQSQ